MTAETKCPGCGNMLKRNPRGDSGEGFNVRQSGG